MVRACRRGRRRRGGVPAFMLLFLGCKRLHHCWWSLSAVGVTGFEPAASSSRTTRATKLRHTPWQPHESTPKRTMLRIAATSDVVGERGRAAAACQPDEHSARGEQRDRPACNGTRRGASRPRGGKRRGAVRGGRWTGGGHDQRRLV